VSIDDYDSILTEEESSVLMKNFIFVN